ncbi:hypothetical protein [Synechococcus sp. CCY 9618]|uniref:hypothetical protein n=1 Tax=Synechococcus sp. CCY 9618 TaxID=2815602 RepID=UPI001C24B9A4|nr:hypothetical protein [Synechococcus sp. CCY 9618]
MKIELSQPSSQRDSRQASVSRSGELGWSSADELAALEAVWDCLCQESTALRPSPRLPELPPSGPVRPVKQLPSRQRQPQGRGDGVDRLAS